MVVKAIVYADGGCRHNGEVGALSYGSFKVLVDGQLKRHREATLSNAITSNEAEYGTLLAVTKYIDEVESKTTRPIEWVIRMDSALVVKQLTGGWKVKAPNLKGTYEVLRAWFKSNSNATLEKVDRNELFTVLGH